MSRIAWLLPLSLGAVFACESAVPTAVATDEAVFQLEDVAIEVTLDIQPLYSDRAVINTRSKSGHVAVGVLSAVGFDATAIDYATVTFLGAGAIHSAEAISDQPNCPEKFAAGHFKDLNADEVLDAVVHFDTGSLTFPEAGPYCLYGSLKDGTAFGGCASAVVR